MSFNPFFSTGPKNSRGSVSVNPMIKVQRAEKKTTVFEKNKARDEARKVARNKARSVKVFSKSTHSLHAENRASKSPNRLIEYEKMIHDMKNSLLNDLEEKMKEMNRPEGFQYEQIIPVLEQMGETVDMYEKKIQDKLKDYAHNVLSQERQSHRTSYINLIEILKGIRVSLEACLKQAKSNINNEIQTEPFEEIKNAIKEYRINRTRNEKKNMFNSLKKRSNSLKLARAEGKRKAPATQLLLNRIGNMNTIRKQFENGDKSRLRALEKKKMFNSLKKRSNSLKLARAEGKRKAPPATQLLLNRIGHNMNTIRKQFENGDKSRLRALEKKKMINAMREKSKRRRPTKFLLNKISRNMSKFD